ncbi:DUF3850 domain-containing protein [Salmonella enterica]|uniref:DUF3850 domain-containing protein n=1 Tax=Salmonella enterica TaxID=28901 RepID=UPI0009AF64EE
MTNNKLTDERVHELKIYPQYFADVKVGVKRAELRLNDRNYRAGDVLRLCEYNARELTGAVVDVDVTHVADVGYWCPGYVVLSIELQERRKAAELMAEKFIGVDPAFGPDRTVEVRYFAPPGYAMVPKEPTPKQWAAGLKAMNEGVDKVSLVYGAMLSAAPQVLPEVSGE